MFLSRVGNNLQTMLPDARALRIHIYERLLDSGLPPTNREIASYFAVSDAEVKRALAELKIGKTVLVHPRTGEIWMAGPFSAVETPYRVIGRRAQWFANCAWDMLGVAMIANEPVRIESKCTDCDSPMSLQADPSRAPTDASVVHFLVPARRWYDDIGFT